MKKLKVADQASSKAITGGDEIHSKQKPYLSWSRSKDDASNRYFDLDQLDFQDSIKLKTKAWVFSLRNASAYRQAKKDNTLDPEQGIYVDNPIKEGDNASPVVNDDTTNLAVGEELTMPAIIKKDYRASSKYSDNYPAPSDYASNNSSNHPSIMANLNINQEDLDLYGEEDISDNLGAMGNIAIESVKQPITTDGLDELFKSSDSIIEPSLEIEEIHSPMIDIDLEILTEEIEILDALDEQKVEGETDSIKKVDQASSIWEDTPLKHHNVKSDDFSDPTTDSSFIDSITMQPRENPYKANIRPEAIQGSINFFNDQGITRTATNKADKVDKVTHKKTVDLNVQGRGLVDTIEQDEGPNTLDNQNDSKWWWDKTGSLDYLAEIDYKDISSSITASQKEASQEVINSFDISGLAKKESRFKFKSIFKKLALLAIVLIGTWLIFFRSGYEQQIDMVKNIIPIWRTEVDIITSSGIKVDKARAQDRIIARVKYKKKYSGIINVNYINRDTDKYLIKNLNMRIDNAEITPIYLPMAQDNGKYIFSVTINGQKIDKQIIIE